MQSSHTNFSLSCNHSSAPFNGFRRKNKADYLFIYLFIYIHSLNIDWYSITHPIITFHHPIHWPLPSSQTKNEEVVAEPQNI